VKLFKKIIAVVMILVSIISLAVSLFLIVQLWKNQDDLTEKLVDGLTSVSDSLTTTGDGLVVVNDTLSNVSTSVSALSDTTLTLADNVNKTSNTIDSFSTLFTKDIPTTITNTQTAIISAQTSAAVIDGVLTGLSSVPLIGLDYNPEESLSSALGEVAASLDQLPRSIQGIGGDLDSTSTSLLNLQTDIQSISVNVSTISKNLDDAQLIVVQYEKQIDELQTTIGQSIVQAPNWIKYAVWALTFLIVWMMVAQAGLLVQGIHLMTSL
jgi:methyl-accepting chemotaxis protein